MPTNYAIPGVYVEEITKFPPAVAQVETAIPAFVGYTERRLDANGGTLAQDTPVRISSMTEFETLFGNAPRLTVTEVRLDADNNILGATISTSFYLHHAVQMFYANGGGDCYIVSVAAAPGFTGGYVSGEILSGVNALELVDEPTLICFPDAAGNDDGGISTSLQVRALQLCAELGDRFTICDTLLGDPLGATFRNEIGINNLKYGAAYTPWLQATFAKNLTFEELSTGIFTRNGVSGLALEALTTDTATQTLITTYRANLGVETADQLADRELALRNNFGLYKAIIAAINGLPLAMPPSGAIAGVYATVDRTRGVWKAPANVSVNLVTEPTSGFTQGQLANLNIDPVAGKSINAIRTFTGKGVLVWGARTLAGNDNEWRYINVRRFYNMVEESVKKAAGQFVFEPNDANTWVRVQGMIENFLTLQWRAGALQGAKQEHAFQVAVGLGKTMTADDILNGRMIVQIAMAPVRPAEFIILRFEQKMPES
ncbi:phage tail sheath family protein [Lewinella cohaerens]|uniref:phage tail sheath family protein n=1 Tax=Lewinella cohaerens TaxID=70995 RepID=UPI000378A3F3|nr:phage tail sheath C-terminal domain-containing protein [Lewinella cohaerens]